MNLGNKGLKVQGRQLDKGENQTHQGIEQESVTEAENDGQNCSRWAHNDACYMYNIGDTCDIDMS